MLIVLNTADIMQGPFKRTRNRTTAVQNVELEGASINQKVEVGVRTRYPSPSVFLEAPRIRCISPHLRFPVTP